MHKVCVYNTCKCLFDGSWSQVVLNCMWSVKQIHTWEMLQEKQKGKYYYSTVVCQCTFVDGRFTNINKYKKNYIQYSCTPDTVYNAIEWTCVTYICMTVKCIRILNRTQWISIRAIQRMYTLMKAWCYFWIHTALVEAHLLPDGISESNTGLWGDHGWLGWLPPHQTMLWGIQGHHHTV